MYGELGSTDRCWLSKLRKRFPVFWPGVHGHTYIHTHPRFFIIYASLTALVRMAFPTRRSSLMVAFYPRKGAHLMSHYGGVGSLVCDLGLYSQRTIELREGDDGHQRVLEFPTRCCRAMS